MAASTPTGSSSPLVRTLGILSVVVALIGVVAVIAKGADNDKKPSSSPGTSGTPIATPTGLRSPSPSASPTITPRPSHTGAHSAGPGANPTATIQLSATPRASHSPAPTTPTTSAPPSSPSPTGSTHQVKLHAPALGNYSYATTGGESTSFPGTARKFPKTTTVSLTKSGCGIQETWKPLSSHVETEQLCIINNQVHLISTQTTLSFFGQTVTQKFTCASNAYVYAPTLRPGDTWSFVCTSKDSKVTQHLKALRYQTFDVGGTNVRTLKISVASTVSGGDSGDSKQTIWIAATNRPQMIRNVASINAKQGSFSYTENQQLQLKSLTPS